MTVAPDSVFTRLARLTEHPRATVLVRCAGALSGQDVTAAQLLDGCRRTADALRAAGVRRGDKAVVMTRDAYHLVACVYALISLGAVPVLIEPRAEVRRCLDEIAPGVFIGEPLAHVARRALGWGRGQVRTALVTGRGLPGRLLGRSLPLAVPDGSGPLPPVPEPRPDDLAMIAFTSGSTGQPKGVEYRCATLAGQLAALDAVLRAEPGDVLLSCFLPFAALGPLLGLTTVAPQVDHLAPARTPPGSLVGPLRRHRATHVLGSPAVLGLIAGHCVRHGLTLPSVRRVLSFGAPLRPRLAEMLAKALPPGAEILSVYGATECLPVAAIDAQELRVRPPAGHVGTCLGRPLPGVRARILDADGTGLGEIAVAGPMVSPAYHARPDATRAAKSLADGALWHRTGDLGRLDGEGRLWYLGRSAHLVIGEGFALTTEDIEAAADTAAGVRRTALVGVGAAGRQRAVLCVEPEPGARRDAVVEALRAVLGDHPDARRIATVLFHPRFPTDIRHNSKIDRARLATYAAGGRR
ncbi:AMP-binding protein [Streptomyces lomondensis]|uniref:Peptide synthase n=1 Tax=Streptomyces lomondensis TaxID=68229 RepID=A0ABQ2XT65_9ACTN|nr:AMP-binding protein [Streptomyces lomondensis]MCF0082350.1 AMP-binding protein [Streptomyces lomondensis]GGX29737.1 peptide synthase [Streptomyces lomondensis]